MSPKNLSAEDRLDGVYRMLAFSMLAIGVLHLVNALHYLLPHAGWFIVTARWIRTSALIVAPLFCVVTLWKSLLFKRACGGCSLVVKDGFVFGAIQKSAVRAGFLVFLLLVMMLGLSEDSTLPARFFLNGALSLLVLTFSISFLVSSYVGNADE